VQLVLPDADTLNRTDLLIGQTSVVQVDDLLWEQHLSFMRRRPPPSWCEHVAGLPWALVVPEASLFQLALQVDDNALSSPQSPGSLARFEVNGRTLERVRQTAPR
jgi:hypothetical protein